MAQTSNAPSALHRAAGEIKRYRVWMRILPIAAGVMAFTMIIVYVVAVLYTKYGSFTVRVNKFDNLDYALTLSETPDFDSSVVRLNAKASEDVTNIDGNDLPDDLDKINGEHNGQNYVAYTFYCKNAGVSTVTYEYLVYIANMTRDIEKAVRVRVYVDGKPTTYARTKTNGGGAEPNTTEFLTESTITRNQISHFKPNDVTKYTVVIWLEGNDPDCIDDIIGGQFKVDMTMSILSADSKSKKNT